MHRQLQILARIAAVAALLVAPAVADDSATPAADVRLAVTPQSGQRFALQDDVEAKVSAFGGTSIVAELHQFSVLRIDSVSLDGTATVREKVARVWGKLSMSPADGIEFDTDDPKGCATAATTDFGRAKSPDGFPWTMHGFVEGGLAAAIAKETVVRIDRDGTSWRRRGEVVAANGSDDLGDPAALGKLPDRPIAIGDSWDADDELSLSCVKTNGIVKVKIKHAVLAIDAESVTVGQDGSVRVDPVAQENRGAAAALSVAIKVKSSSVKGTTRISRKDGLTLTADLEVTADAGMELGLDSTPSLRFQFRVKAHQERRPAPAEAARPPSAGGR